MATSFEQAANALRKRFKDEFHALRSTPIAFANMEGLIDQNGNVQQEAVDSNGQSIPWVRMTINAGQAFQQSSGPVGSRRFRQVGTVIVQIFVPSGTGDGEVFAIADDVASALRGVTDTGVVLKATTPPQIAGPDGGWWQANSDTEFHFDLTA